MADSTTTRWTQRSNRQRSCRPCSCGRWWHHPCAPGRPDRSWRVRAGRSSETEASSRPESSPMRRSWPAESGARPASSWRGRRRSRRRYRAGDERVRRVGWCANAELVDLHRADVPHLLGRCLGLRPAARRPRDFAGQVAVVDQCGEQPGGFGAEHGDLGGGEFTAVKTNKPLYGYWSACCRTSIGRPGQCGRFLAGRDAELAVPALISLLDSHKDDIYTVEGVSQALDRFWTGRQSRGAHFVCNLYECRCQHRPAYRKKLGRGTAMGIEGDRHRGGKAGGGIFGQQRAIELCARWLFANKVNQRPGTHCGR